MTKKRGRPKGTPAKGEACMGINKDGSPCSNYQMEGSIFCRRHAGTHGSTGELAVTDAQQQLIETHCKYSIRNFQDLTTHVLVAREKLMNKTETPQAKSKDDVRGLTLYQRKTIEVQLLRLVGECLERRLRYEEAKEGSVVIIKEVNLPKGRTIEVKDGQQDS